MDYSKWFDTTGDPLRKKWNWNLDSTLLHNKSYVSKKKMNIRRKYLS